MDISILFNWPPGKDFARVSFGGHTVDELKNQFRVGVIKKDEDDKIYWLKPGWIDAVDMHGISFDVQIGEKVVIEKRQKEIETILTRNIWDIEEKWPDNATGDSSVVVPWTFH